MNPLGIMQGRFTSKDGFLPQQFPWTAWEKEFEISRRVGIQCVEWMFNYENFRDNPLITDFGQRKLARVLRKLFHEKRLLPRRRCDRSSKEPSFSNAEKSSPCTDFAIV